MKKSPWVAGVICAFLAFGCAYKHELLVNPEFSMPPNVSLTTVGRDVHATLAEIGWIIDKEEPGATTAHIKQDDLYAQVRVEYNEKQATVRYLDSKNFLYTKLPSGEERIHSHYLLWARHIASNLQDRLNRDYHVE